MLVRNLTRSGGGMYAPAASPVTPPPLLFMGMVFPVRVKRHVLGGTILSAYYFAK